ncbi:hypothetical protein LL3_02385 [Bacillus amyloliquefaciens LL3]|nr:hypothetical protein LL3_02385 [Bacillus amyloliquefaciens LL3]
MEVHLIAPRSLSILNHSFIDLILTEQTFFIQYKQEQSFDVIVGNDYSASIH